jgi:ABC-type lipoprotein export system ATPase subunit
MARRLGWPVSLGFADGRRTQEVVHERRTALSKDTLFTLVGVRRNYIDTQIAFCSDHGEARVSRGGVIGILGPSGSGKTTLLNLLGLLDNADEGRIIYHAPDRDIHYRELYKKTEDIAAVRARYFGYVFQEDELLDQFDAASNVQVPLWFSSGNQLKGEKLRELFRALDLKEGYINKNPADLSVGQRSKVGLLRALLRNPDVIFADEPTANVDEKSQDTILSLLVEWCRKDSSRTILLSTHNLRIASRFCDRYWIFPEASDGRKEDGCRKEDSNPGYVGNGSPLQVVSPAVKIVPRKIEDPGAL